MADNNATGKDFLSSSHPGNFNVVISLRDLSQSVGSIPMTYNRKVGPEGFCSTRFWAEVIVQSRSEVSGLVFNLTSTSGLLPLTSCMLQTNSAT